MSEPAKPCSINHTLKWLASFPPMGFVDPNSRQCYSGVQCLAWHIMCEPEVSHPSTDIRNTFSTGESCTIEILASSSFLPPSSLSSIMLINTLTLVLECYSPRFFDSAWTSICQIISQRKATCLSNLLRKITRALSSRLRMRLDAHKDKRTGFQVLHTD